MKTIHLLSGNVLTYSILSNWASEGNFIAFLPPKPIWRDTDIDRFALVRLNQHCQELRLVSCRKDIWYYKTIRITDKAITVLNGDTPIVSYRHTAKNFRRGLRVAFGALFTWDFEATKQFECEVQQ